MERRNEVPRHTHIQQLLGKVEFDYISNVVYKEDQS